MLVYRTVEKKLRLAKAAYLGAKDVKTQMVMKKAKHSKKMNRYFIAPIYNYNDILLCFF